MRTDELRTVTPSRPPAGQRLFRALNRYVEPAVRRGVGSPIHGPGAVVVETIGRRSGVPRRVPLLGWRSGDTVTVSTVRADSDWVRNLERHPVATVWIGGEPRTSTATVTRTPAATIVQLQTARASRHRACSAAPECSGERLWSTAEPGEQAGRRIGDRAGRERMGQRDAHRVGTDEVAMARPGALDR